MSNTPPPPLETHPPHKFNPRDTLSKHLTKAEVEMIMEHIQHFFEQGRAAVAPKLAIMDEKNINHDEELHVVTKDVQNQICDCRGCAISIN